MLLQSVYTLGNRMQQDYGQWLGSPLMAETQSAALGQRDLREPLCVWRCPPHPPVGPGVTSGTCEVQEWGVLLSTPWCCACSMQSQGSYVVGQQREWPPRPGASPHPCLSVARGLTVKEGGLGTCAWQRSQGHTGGPQGARVPLPAKPLTECPEQRLSPRGHFVPSSE